MQYITNKSAHAEQYGGQYSSGAGGGGSSGGGEPSPGAPLDYGAQYAPAVGDGNYGPAQLWVGGPTNIIAIDESFDGGKISELNILTGTIRHSY